ncbi:hypothetical protein HK096_005678, partial [Nowakowskiella sp. JEL0078]
MVNLFNVGAFFVLLRETLEVCVVLAVLFSLIKKSIPNKPALARSLRKMVWIGSSLGLLISLLFGAAFTITFYIVRQDFFSSVEPIWEGSFKLIATIMLTWLAFSMIGVEKWHSKFEKKLQEQINKTIAEEDEKTLLDKKKGSDEEFSIAESNATKVINRPWGLFVLAFTVIVREGVESVVFLTGVGQGDPYSLIIPGILGIAVGLCFGYYFWNQTSKLNMRLFLLVSTIVLFVLSAGLLAGAAHEFEEIAYLRAGLAQQEYLNLTLPPNLTAPVFQGGQPAQKLRRSNTVELYPRDATAPASPPKREVKADPACPGNSTTCTVRTYYIAAVEVEWDYAPSGYNHFMGVPFVRDPEGAGLYALHSDEKLRIGSVFTKALYFEYTDETFTTQKAKPDWQGIQGPIIRAEVGDVLRIKFKNLASTAYSMHPHGVFYNATSEGALSQIRQLGASVEPNETYEYVWSVPTRAGPGPNDGTSVLWAYHSHHHEAMDVYSGLIGPLIVYSSGILNKTTDFPTDFDREYVLYLSVINEMNTNYVETNIIQKLGITDPTQIADTLANSDFEEPNLKHSINGRLFNNLDGLVANVGESVKWHAMSMGTEVDIHTLHFHGLTALENGHRTDVVELFPASFKTITMGKGDIVSPGSWLIHCHVADHIKA